MGTIEKQEPKPNQQDELNEGLSDEERAALADDDAGAGGGGSADPGKDAGPAPAATAAQDPGKQSTDAAADAGKPAADAGKDAGTAPAASVAPGKGDDAAAPAGATEATAPFVPRYPAKEERLTEIDQRLGTIKTESEALFGKFDAGDLTAKEYHAQSEAMRDEQMRLVSEQATIKTAQEMNSLTAEQQWEHEQRGFFGAAENKIFFALDDKGEIKRDADGAPEFDPIAYGALDATVKAVAGSKDAQGKSGGWVLAEARRRVAQKLNLGAAPAAPALKQAQGALKDGKPKTGPQTLAGVPAADAADDLQGDEFADLDRLIDTGDVFGYESALAQMSPEQQARYLDVGHPGAPEYRRRGPPAADAASLRRDR